MVAHLLHMTICREPAREIPPMTRSCGEAWWARWVRPQGFPLDFPEHLPPKNQSLPALLYCAFPLFWHSLEKVNLGLQSSAFERNVSAQNPSDGSLTCLTGSPGLFTTCELFTTPPTTRGMKLRASQRYRASSKKLKIILVTGFHCWVNDCC